MGTQPIPLARSPRRQEEEPVLQDTTTASRRFQILTRHREEEIATRQAEAAFADLCWRYPGQVGLFNRGTLHEWFAPECLVGYVINGEIEALETIIALPDGMCLSYDGLEAIPQK